MIKSKISSKFQVVIPAGIRKSLSLEAGQEVQMLQYLDRIEIIPLRKNADMKGFLKGMNSDFKREPDRL